MQPAECYSSTPRGRPPIKSSLPTVPVVLGTTDEVLARDGRVASSPIVRLYAARNGTLTPREGKTFRGG